MFWLIRKMLLSRLSRGHLNSLKWLEKLRHPGMIPHLLANLCKLYEGVEKTLTPAQIEMEGRVYSLLALIDPDYSARPEAKGALVHIVRAINGGLGGWRARRLLACLGGMKDADGIPCLQSVLATSADAYTRTEAATALIRMDLPTALDIARDAFLSSRCNSSVGKLLLERGGVHMILPAFAAEDELLRREAVSLLDDASSPEDRATLIRAALDCWERFPSTRSYCTLALNDIGIRTPDQIADEITRRGKVKSLIEKLELSCGNLLECLHQNGSNVLSHLKAICALLRAKEWRSEEAIPMIEALSQELKGLKGPCVSALQGILKRVARCTQCDGVGSHEHIVFRSNSGLSNSGGSRSLGLGPCGSCRGTGKALNLYAMMWVERQGDASVETIFKDMG